MATGDFDKAWSRISGREIDPAPEPKVRERHDLIQPTPEEIANGWDAESLTKYVREREQATADRINPHDESRRKGPVQAAGYRWSFPAKSAWTVGKSRWTVQRRGSDKR